MTLPTLIVIEGDEVREEEGIREGTAGAEMGRVCFVVLWDVRPRAVVLAIVSYRRRSAIQLISRTCRVELVQSVKHAVGLTDSGRRYPVRLKSN